MSVAVDIPSHRSWPAVISIAAGTFLLVTSEFLPIGLLTPIAEALRATEGLTGLSVTIPGIVAAVAAPGFTLLAGAIDRRLILLALTALIIASNIVSMFAPNLATLLAGRVLLGIGVGGLWTFAVASARRLVTETEGGQATAIVSAGIGIGTVVGVPVGVAIGSMFDWRIAFAAVAGFGAVVLAAQFTLLPPLPAQAQSGWVQLRALAKIPRARVGLLATFLVASGQFAAYTYIEPYLREAPRFDQAALTTALVIYGISGIAGTFAGERAAAANLRAAFTGATLALGSILIALLLLSATPLIAFVLVALWGFTFGAIPVCIQIWMYSSSPANFEGGSALMVSVFQVALAFGAFAGGMLVDASGLSAALLAGGALALAAGLVLLVLPPRMRTATD